MFAYNAIIIIQQAAETLGDHPERLSYFERIAEWCTEVVDAIHYPGVFVLMALESMIAPIPSEAVMPFAGFLAFEGRMTMLWIAVSSTLGSIVGSLLSYWMGLYGGRPLVLKVGKYLLLNVHHLDATERFFNRFGTATVFICRFIPVIRHFISIPAGMGRMPIVPFLIMTAIGAGMWNMFLAWAGWWLKDNWNSLRGYFHIIDYVIVTIILLVIVAFIARQIIEWLSQKKAAAGDDIS